MSWGDPITPDTISPLALLFMLHAAGHTLTVKADGLHVSNRRALSGELQSAIRRCKPDLLLLAKAVDA